MIPVLAAGLFATCAAVELHGDAQLVSRLQPLLLERGLGRSQAPPCRTLLARVEPRAQGISVELFLAQGRSARRVVGTPSAAAAVLDSWARLDLRPLEPQAPAAIASPAPAALLHASGLLDLGVDDAGRVWKGLTVSVGRRTGPADLVLLARLQVADELATLDRTGAGLTGGDLVLAAERVLHAGGLSLIPRGGVGIGAVHVRRGGSCSGCTTVSDDFERLVAGPRLEIAGSASWPFTDHLALDLALDATWDPTAGEAQAPSYATPLAAPLRDALSIAATPRLLGRVSLGLRVHR